MKYSLTALDSDTLQSSVNSPITALVRVRQSQIQLSAEQEQKAAPRLYPERHNAQPQKGLNSFY